MQFFHEYMDGRQTDRRMKIMRNEANSFITHFGSEKNT